MFNIEFINILKGFLFKNDVARHGKMLEKFQTKREKKYVKSTPYLVLTFV